MRGHEGPSDFTRLPQGWWQPRELLVLRFHRIGSFSPSILQAAGVAARVTQSCFGTSGIPDKFAELCLLWVIPGHRAREGQGENGSGG